MCVYSVHANLPAGKLGGGDGESTDNEWWKDERGRKERNAGGKQESGVKY